MIKAKPRTKALPATLEALATRLLFLEDAVRQVDYNEKAEQVRAELSEQIHALSKRVHAAEQNAAVAKQNAKALQKRLSVWGKEYFENKGTAGPTDAHKEAAAVFFRGVTYDELFKKLQASEAKCEALQAKLAELTTKEGES